MPQGIYDRTTYNAGWDNRGEKNPRYISGIDSEVVIEMNKNGKTLGEIAEYFGVGRDCIRNRFKTAGVEVINHRYRKGRYRHSKDTKEKIGRTNKDKRAGKTWEEIYGVKKATELKKAWVENQRKKFAKGGNPIYLPGVKEKLSELAKERLKDPNELRKILVYSGQNKQEKYVESFLNYLGYEYRFVGDGKLIIGGKCPDFCLGFKLIEFFGSRWHEVWEEDYRTRHFKGYGYETLIVWDYELKDMNKL